jgi:hypothetical protein
MYIAFSELAEQCDDRQVGCKVGRAELSESLRYNLISLKYNLISPVYNLIFHAQQLVHEQ